MRLAGITHLGIRMNGIESRNTRIVVYVAQQRAPVYISEARVVGPHSVVDYNKVDFSNSLFSREFNIAVQIWVYANRWVQIDECCLDLRDLRPVCAVEQPDPAKPGNTSDESLHVPNLQTPGSGLVIYSHNNEMALPSMQLQEDIETHFPSSPVQHGSISTRLYNWYCGEKSAETSTESNETTSLSYPQLVDLWTLENSLKQSLLSSQTLSSDVNELIKTSQIVLEIKQNALHRKMKLLHQCIRKITAECDSLKEKTEIEKGACERIDEMVKSQSQFQSQLPKLPNTVEAQSAVNEYTEKIRLQQARLAKELLDIFPIEPVDDHKFVFSICGIVLPSVFAINHYDPVQVGAALGFVAQVVISVSRYLDVPLAYPVTFFGSQSCISDNISVIKHGSTQFPLWTRGTLLYRVEYALYLLHKDIEKLMSAVNLAVVDLKQTLANLKNLLLVISTE